jgi:hypothetical protein
MGPPRRGSEIGEQQAAFPGSQGDDTAVGVPEVKAAEKVQRRLPMPFRAIALRTRFLHCGRDLTRFSRCRHASWAAA